MSDMWRSRSAQDMLGGEEGRCRYTWEAEFRVFRAHCLFFHAASQPHVWSPYR
jgi:hypothetical protein